MRCEQCGTQVDVTHASRTWCSPVCHHAWRAGHPEEEARWVSVEDATPAASRGIGRARGVRPSAETTPMARQGGPENGAVADSLRSHRRS